MKLWKNNNRKAILVPGMLLFSFYVFVHSLSTGPAWRMALAAAGFIIFLSLFAAVLYQRYVKAS